MLYVHANVEAFPERLLDSVRALIGSDITCYTEIGNEAVLNVADPPSDTLDALVPLLAELQDQHPRIQDFKETGETSARTVSDYLSKRAWHQRDIYQHFYGALGLEDQVSIMMPTQPGVVIGLVANRARRSFRKRDRQLMDLFRPHMVLAWKNARAVSSLEGEDLSTVPAQATSVIRLRNDGAIEYATPNAQSKLRHGFRTQRFVAGLPAPVRAWVDAHVKGRDVSDPSPRRHTRKMPVAGGNLVFSMVREPDLDGWVLLVQGERRARPELPPRLQRTLERLLAGESEKEIATRLELSPHTVHEYVKQLYRRFDVSSRSELMARWISSNRRSD